MKYDFDRLTDRKGTGSLKWDVPDRELPMWVADMDFETAPEIIEVLKTGGAWYLRLFRGDAGLV